MNRRTLKKRCKRAMAVLIKEYAYRPDQFAPACGDEAIDAPAGMERRHVWSDWLEPGPLKGTPLYYYRTSWECDEWGCQLPTDVLSELEHWSNFTEADARRMLADSGMTT